MFIASFQWYYWVIIFFFALGFFHIAKDLYIEFFYLQPLNKKSNLIRDQLYEKEKELTELMKIIEPSFTYDPIREERIIFFIKHLDSISSIVGLQINESIKCTEDILLRLIYIYSEIKKNMIDLKDLEKRIEELEGKQGI